MKNKKTPVIIDQKELFATALAFYRASSKIEKYRDKDINLSYPNIVLEAISLELLLKTVFCINYNKNPPNNHDLWVLFYRLSQDSKNSIMEIYNRGPYESNIIRRTRLESSIGRKLDFEYVLKMSKDAFISFRYVYERKIENGSGWLASDILAAAAMHVYALKPEWLAEVVDNKVNLPILADITRKIEY